MITGSSGFLGTNLAEAARPRPEIELCLVDVRPPRLPLHDPTYRKVDILDRDQLQGVFRQFRPSHVVHLAARTDLRGLTAGDYPANVQGVSNVIAACEDMHDEPRVLFASSRLVFDIHAQPDNQLAYSPQTAYGASKAVAEGLVRGSRLKRWVLVRPTSIWGPWFGTPYFSFFSLIRRGLYMHPRGVSVPKSFGYVGNSVRQLFAMLTAPDQEVAGAILWLADPEPLDVGRWADEIADAFEVRRPRRVPIRGLQVLAAAGDILQTFHVPAPLTSFRLENLTAPMVYDTSQTTSVCGDAVFDTASGIGETVQWMREHTLGTS